MAIRHDQGIVLRSYPFGESDRVVIIISPNHGKLRTVAKGVRKTKSRFGGRLEPLTHIDLVLYEGRNLDTITQVSVIEAFPHVRTDLERVGVAGAMLSAIDAVAQEDESAHRLFLLLHRGLRVLDSSQPDPGLLTAFYLKLAALVGIAPALGDCASCGRDVGVERFSFAAGGVVCERCVTADAVKLRPGLVDYLAALAGSELATLPPNDGMAGDGQGLARRFLEYHLERRFTVAEVPGG
jgi:DNA repair protein RecO (recombination protein O)